MGGEIIMKKSPAPKNGSKAVKKEGSVKAAGSGGEQGKMKMKSERESIGKSGRKEENSAQMPRIRVLFALFRQNQNERNPRKRFPTVKEIGAILDPDRPLSANTVRNILAMMRDDFGLPVDFIPARGGHGFTEPVAGFELDAISEEQVYYLIQSVQMLGIHRRSKAFADIRKAVKRACLGITLALGVEFEEIEEALSFHVLGFDAPAPVDPEQFKAAMRAILNRREVRLEHRSAKRPGEVRERVVQPLHLAMINHALYLWHYDPDVRAGRAVRAGQAEVRAGRADEGQAQEKRSDGIRKFALTRIGKFQETGRGFERPRGFDIRERLKNGMGAFDEEDAAEVRIRFTPKVTPFIMERTWHESQVMERLPDECGGGVMLTLRVAHTPELEAFALRWAGDMEVVEPVPLRARMRELGEALVRSHE
jgi:predicted DNA-binding transcriptional regulator YafY